MTVARIVSSRCSRRAWIVAAIVSLAALAVAATPQLLGPEVTNALGRLDDASPQWLWAAGAAFVAAVVANAWAWRSAVLACGGRAGRGETVAWYGVGSLVNSAVPARVGDAVRIALFSRAFDSRDRLWTTGGVFTAMGAARALCLAVLVVGAWLGGAIPLWPVAVLGGIVAAAVTAAVVARNGHAGSRVSHLLDAFRSLGRSPAAGARVVGWVACATAAKLVGVVAILAALGVDSPFGAAVILVPALDFAGLVPITPGNFGLGSGAVAVALQAKGVSLTTALSAAIALHAVESGVSIVLGLGGALLLARFESPVVRHWTVRIAGTAACVALAAAFGATVLLQLV